MESPENTINLLKRGGSQLINEGELKMGALEIARLDNDANFPERGVFRPVMEGGQ